MRMMIMIMMMIFQSETKSYVIIESCLLRSVDYLIFFLERIRKQPEKDDAPQSEGKKTKRNLNNATMQQLGTSIKVVSTAALMFEIFMALRREASLTDAHSFNYSNPLTPFPLRFRSMSKRRIGRRVVDFRNVTKATFLTGNTMPSVLPSIRVSEREGRPRTDGG